MNVEILSSAGAVLRALPHAGQTFVEVPTGYVGEYQVRLTNPWPARRLAVLSVDGINVVDGSDAGYDGPGYVLEPFASVTVKGFLRSNAECARFQFADTTASYAAGTGRGTKNVGVIGVAVFDERVQPVRFTPPYVVQRIVNPVPWSTNPQSWWGNSTLSSTTGGQAEPTFSVNCSTADVPMASLSHPYPPSARSSARLAKPTRSTKSAAPAQAQPLGTAYGRAEAFHTQATAFTRATASPAGVVTLRYAATETLRAWGVPVDAVAPPAPSAFPASPGFAQAPAGWQR